MFFTLKTFSLPLHKCFLSPFNKGNRNTILVKSYFTQAVIYMFQYNRFDKSQNLATPLPIEGGSRTVCARPMHVVFVYYLFLLNFFFDCFISFSFIFLKYFVKITSHHLLFLIHCPWNANCPQCSFHHHHTHHSVSFKASLSLLKICVDPF